MANTELTSVQMTKQHMLDRVQLLSSEMDANDKENRQYQAEIDALYKQIDVFE